MEINESNTKPKRLPIYGGLAGKLALDNALNEAKAQYEKTCLEIWDDVEQEAIEWIKSHPHDSIQLEYLRKYKDAFYG